MHIVPCHLWPALCRFDCMLSLHPAACKDQVATVDLTSLNHPGVGRKEVAWVSYQSGFSSCRINYHYTQGCEGLACRRGWPCCLLPAAALR